MVIKNFNITYYRDSPCDDSAIASLLDHTFIKEGFTDQTLAQTLFALSEIKKRGEIILARSFTSEVVGMVVCAVAPNPACRVAKPDEVEVQLFSVDPKARGQGIADALIEASEGHARSLGFTKIVLSTQPMMKAAHKVYERHGYKKNPARDWQRDETAFLVYEKMISTNEHTPIK